MFYFWKRGFGTSILNIKMSTITFFFLIHYSDYGNHTEPRVETCDKPPRLGRRPLGRTGIQVSPIALSAWSVRAAGKAGLKLSASDVERAFHEHGINTFLVTWQMREVAEGVRRLVRAGHRDELVLITEVGIPTAGFISRGFEKNARALGVEMFDVVLLGWVQAHWYVTGKSWPAMLRLKEEGKTRAIGFSSHNRLLAARLAREIEVDVLMIRYNAAHRGAEREVFAAFGDDRPAFIAYTATRWGMLLQPLPKAGFPKGMTAPECYRFALSHPSVDMVLCAARTPGEVREDVAGLLEGPLDPSRHAEACRYGDAVHAAARGGLRWMFR
ncbi:MAG: Aldo ket red protein [Actinobacteria bacterium]|nr:Aldo ket red protein [Actinomycetota bacterium]